MTLKMITSALEDQNNIFFCFFYIFGWFGNSLAYIPFENAYKVYNWLTQRYIVTFGPLNKSKFSFSQKSLKMLKNHFLENFSYFRRSNLNTDFRILKLASLINNKIFHQLKHLFSYTVTFSQFMLALLDSCTILTDLMVTTSDGHKFVQTLHRYLYCFIVSTDRYKLTPSVI
jgi:hypothetical protein